MSKDQRRAQTKKALLDALVICLEDQDFNDITTIRLVQTAGISRSSFYTHYKDKYEMIDSYQKELFHKLEYIFDKYEGKKEEHTKKVINNKTVAKISGRKRQSARNTLKQNVYKYISETTQE